jgi:hypothetical protein
MTVLSALDPRDFAQRLQADCLPKPVAVDDLLHRVRQVCPPLEGPPNPRKQACLRCFADEPVAEIVPHSPPDSWEPTSEPLIAEP